jgi:queuine tRNA-ribosyltransferase
MPTPNARNGHLFTAFRRPVNPQRRPSQRQTALDETSTATPAAAKRARTAACPAASRAPTCTTWSAAAKCWGRCWQASTTLHYYLNLMQEVRDALEAGRFADFARRFRENRARGV